MDRRDSLKYIVLGSVATSLAFQGCKPEVDEIPAVEHQDDNHFGRTPEEKELIKELNSKQFFNEHEMETMAVLCNLILPPNDKLGGAVEAEVPDFIEFMSKDYPPFQVPLRGGFMWIDHTSNEKFGTEFKSASVDQQKSILDTIAFPDIKDPDNVSLGERFFTLMRNLTLTGYYTSPMGIEDIGYKGNTPNVWDGIPEDVLAQHGVAYEKEWLAKCIDQSKRGILAEWDDDGNLLT